MTSAGVKRDIDEELMKSLVAGRLFGGAPGVTLGKFRLVRYLGRGAVGVVYEAIDPERGPVAVKLLSQADPRGVYQVKREFRSIAGLQHPNLITLHELVHEDDHWFFSMELVNGVPFDQWARPHGSLDEDKLRAGLRQLSAAVAAIHAAGKLHRDLKPSNVLVTLDGVVKVLDFGLVSDHVDGVHAPDTGLAGTPEYIAPEQVAGQPVSPAADWYAVGVMMYRALTGCPLFEGDPLTILRAKQDHAAPRLQVPGGASPELYELCERLLVSDPARRANGDDVLAATQQLAEPISLPSAALAAIQAAPFVGREAQLEVLRTAVRAAAAGTSSLMLIGGPSGIGKTALLDRFASELSDGVLVLRGRCHEQESLPYKVFDAVIDAIARYLRTWRPEQAQLIAPRHLVALTRLFPVLGRVEAFASAGSRALLDDPSAVRAQAFSAVKELLLRLTDHNRVVIILDDLQWGDLDSARMMAHVLGPPEPPPLLFVGAYRGEQGPSNPLVSALLDERINGTSLHVQQLTIEPLATSAAAHLASQLLNRDDAIGSSDVEPLAQLVANEAAGVPLFITELVEQVRARRAKNEPYDVLASLDQAVLDRVQLLPEPCRELLDVLVVASGPIEPKVALAAALLPKGDRSPLVRLRETRLLRGHGTTSNEAIEIYHDRIRASLATRLTADRTRTLHARIAAAMQLHGVRDPDRLVGHYIGANDRALAAQAALSAAKAASTKLAFNRAAELYGRALELLSPSDPQVLELRVHLADALANAGRGARASEQYLWAAKEVHPERSRALQLKAAQQCLRSGLTARGIELAEPLLNHHGVSLRGGRARLIFRLLVERALGSMPIARTSNVPLAGDDAERLATVGGLLQEFMFTDPIRGAILLAVFVRHAMRQPDPSLRLIAKVWTCIQAALLGGRRNDRIAAETFREVSELRRQINTPYALAMEHLAAARMHQHAARFATGFEHGRLARQLFDECPGTYWESAHAALNQFACSELVGDLREITLVAPELARVAAERGDDGSLMQVSFSVALARLAHDEPEPTLAFLENRFAQLTSTYSILHYLACHRIADCLIYMGRGAEAFDFVQKQWSNIVGMDYYRSAFIKVVVHSMRARCAISSYDQRPSAALLPLIRSDLKRVEKLQHGFGGVGLTLLGNLHFLEGDRAGAIALLERGVAQLEAEGIERFLHCAKRRLGQVLGGEHGAQLVERADAILVQQEVRRPERFSAVMVADLGQSLENARG